MFFVRARGEVSAEAHGDCARRDLGQSRRHDDLGRGYGRGEPRARAKGTVKPSAIPITTSRTDSEPVKCLSTCGVAGKTCLPGADRSETYDRGCPTASFTPPAFAP